MIAMTKRALRIGLSIALLAAAVLRAQQSQPPAQPQASDQANRQGTIVKNVNLVDVLYSVVTKREKLITDLNKEDFKVFDDGVQQEITSFSQPTDLPLRIGMVLDTSNSIRDRLKFEQDAAIGHPVVGDILYGAPRTLRAGTRNLPLLERNFLHAARIGFSHPSSGAWVEVRAPLPRDLRVYCEQIADSLGWRDAEIDAALAAYL